MIVQPTGDKCGHYALFVAKLTQAMVRHGRRVVVVTDHIDMGPYGGCPEGAEIVEVSGGRLHFDETKGGSVYYWVNYFRNSFLVLLHALRLAKRRGITDIYVTDCEFLMASLVLLWLRAPKRHLLMQVNAANFSYADYRSNSVLKKLYKSFQTKIFRLALRRRIAGINVLGQWHARRLREQLRLGPDYPILVVPDGADLSDQPIDRIEARRRLGLPQDLVLILAFGNFRRDKDYATLFAALGRMRSPGLKAMLVGHLAEYSREEIEQMVDQAGAQHRIALFHSEFVPPAMVREVFSACDGLILAYGRTYTDGSGPLRLEASTYARAVLASDVAEMGSLIRSYDLGRVYPAGDSETLACVLDEFAGLPASVRDGWGRNCRRLGTENSWDAMAEKFDAFLRTGDCASIVSAQHMTDESVLGGSR